MERELIVCVKDVGRVEGNLDDPRVCVPPRDSDARTHLGALINVGASPSSASHRTSPCSVSPTKLRESLKATSAPGSQSKNLYLVSSGLISVLPILTILHTEPFRLACRTHSGVDHQQTVVIVLHSAPPTDMCLDEWF